MGLLGGALSSNQKWRVDQGARQRLKDTKEGDNMQHEVAYVLHPAANNLCSIPFKHWVFFCFLGRGRNFPSVTSIR